MHDVLEQRYLPASGLDRRALPLAADLLGGDPNAGEAGGVVLGLRHPVSIVTVRVPQSRSDRALQRVRTFCGIDLPGPGRSAAAESLTIHWGGYEQWHAVEEWRPDGRLYAGLADALDGIGFCFDQSHGRTILTLSGKRARDVLAKGTAIDLHPSVFGAGDCATTRMAHIDIHLACIADDRFEISLTRSFFESLWRWLLLQSQEFLFQIDETAKDYIIK